MRDNKSLIIFLTLLFTFIGGGCSTVGSLRKPSLSSRQEYIRDNPRLSAEIKQTILEGKVIKGMTKDDVRASWGEPSEMDDFSTNPNAWWYEEDGEGWWYKPPLLSFEHTRFVKFKNGIVERTSKLAH